MVMVASPSITALRNGCVVVLRDALERRLEPKVLVLKRVGELVRNDRALHQAAEPGGEHEAVFEGVEIARHLGGDEVFERPSVIEQCCGINPRCLNSAASSSSAWPRYSSLMRFPT